MESSPRRPHVAIFCFPFGSHTVAAYALARQLAAAVAAAPVATFSLLSTARATALLPQFARPGKYPNLRIHAVPDGRPEGFVPDPREPVREIELFLAAAPGVFREGAAAAVRAAGGTGITCLVSDSFLGFAVEIASEMGVPMVQFFAGAPRSFLVHLHTDVLRRRLGTGRQDLSTENDGDVGGNGDNYDSRGDDGGRCDGNNGSDGEKRKANEDDERWREDGEGDQVTAKRGRGDINEERKGKGKRGMINFF